MRTAPSSGPRSRRSGYPTVEREHRDTFGAAGLRAGLAALGLVWVDRTRGRKPYPVPMGRKRIPDAYLRASQAQRLALLQGLVDTDGTVNANGYVSLCTVSAELALGYRELVRTLGVKAGLSAGRAVLRGKDCGAVFRIGFYLEGAARLPRKRVRCRNAARTPQVYVDATPAGRADTKCVTVDSPSHLYLAGESMLPTHNSTYISFVLPLWYLGRYPERSILAVTSSDTMSHQFHGTVALGLSANPAHQAVFPEQACRPDLARGWSTDGLYLQGVPAGTKDPSYRCSGFGASVIGSRAHCLLLDDPVTQKTATCQVEMQRVRQLLDMTVLPRLHPNGSALCITTRWGEDDVAAHLLKQGWDLLHTPALGDFPWLAEDAPRDEEGRGSLWPAQWSLEWLLNERRPAGGRAVVDGVDGRPRGRGGRVVPPRVAAAPAPRLLAGSCAPDEQGDLR